MAESRNLVLARQLAADEIVHAIAARRLPQLEEHFHDVGVGPHVQRSFECADRSDHGGVDVGQRGCRDTCGKSRRIELVISMQNKRNVECPDCHGVWPFAREHVQERGRVAHRGVRLDEATTGLQPAPRRDNGADLRRQADRLSVLRGRRAVRYLRVVVA